MLGRGDLTNGVLPWITKTRYQAGTGLRSYSEALSPLQYIHIQNLPHVPPWGAPQKVLELQSWVKHNGFILGLCLDWELTFSTTINTPLPSSFQNTQCCQLSSIRELGSSLPAMEQGLCPV